MSKLLIPTTLLGHTLVVVALFLNLGSMCCMLTAKGKAWCSLGQELAGHERMQSDMTKLLVRAATLLSVTSMPSMSMR
jgi:hypothetical protein